MDRLQTRSATLNNFAIAYYTPMRSGFSMIDENLFASASDEAEQTAAVSNVSIFNKGIISPERNPLSYLYTNYYDGIRAAHFFLGAHLLCARTCGVGTHVNHSATLFHYLIGPLGYVYLRLLATASKEGVRRHVQDSHHLWL